MRGATKKQLKAERMRGAPPGQTRFVVWPRRNEGSRSSEAIPRLLRSRGGP